MAQTCHRCSRVNPEEASYCYFDGNLLQGHARNGGLANPGGQLFPNPFVFPNGHSCQNFDQFAIGCMENWAAASDMLRQGFLESFLGGLGRTDLAQAARAAAAFPDRDRGLDQLLSRLPTQALQPPKLQVEPRELNLGQIRPDGDHRFELHLTNQGMRLLYGAAVSDSKWLSLGDGPGGAQKLFQCGTDAVIPVHVHGQHLRAGARGLEGRIVLESNGGMATVTIRAEVPVKPFPQGVLAGAISPRQVAEKAKASPKEAAAL